VSLWNPWFLKTEFDGLGGLDFKPGRPSALYFLSELEKEGSSGAETLPFAFPPLSFL
jgi:hypothetical protein